MNRSLENIVRLAELISCALMVAMVILITFAIVGRWFGILFGSAEELSTFAMVCMAFFGMPAVYVRGAHVRIATITDRVSDGTRRAFLLFSLGVALTVIAILVYYTAWMAFDAFKFGDRSIGLSNTPLWIPQSALPIGLSLLGIAVLVDFVLVLRGDVDRAREPTGLDQPMVE